MLRKIYFLFSLFSVITINPIFSENNLKIETEISGNDIPKPDYLKDYNDMPSNQFQKSFFRMLSLITAFILVIIFCFWIFRKIVHNKTKIANQSKSIKILEKRVLSPKSMLFLVEVEKEKVLIVESQVKVETIHTLTNAEKK